MVETIKHRLSYSNHPNTYTFLYTHKGSCSFCSATEFFGTTHGDDLIPLFPMHKRSFYSSVPTENDRELTKLMSSMWTNFVRTGWVIEYLKKKHELLTNRTIRQHSRNPTPDNATTPIWPLATGFPLNYMQIGNENGKFDSQILQPRVDFYSSRANFWMELRNEYRISSWLEGSSSSTSSRCSMSLAVLLLTCWSFMNNA